MRKSEKEKVKSEKYRKIQKIFSVAFAFLGLFTFHFSLFTPSAFAGTACTCFCGTAPLGAVQQAGTSSDSNACIDSCRDQDMEPQGCFTREDDYPEHSETCWLEDECTSNDATNVWANDVAACDDHKNDMGYCYAGPRSFTSAVAIGGDSTFSGLPDYVNTLYKYLVPAMTIVAIIMVMVGGLQYILSRGNASAVKMAKERITQAVIGLVLLLSAFTLANLLDPHLVNFDELRIPKIKQVVLLTDSNSCKYLSSVGMTIDGVEEASFTDKTCSFDEGATKGKVTDISEVDSNADVGGWQEGDECNYTKCEDGATCSSDGCVACADLALHNLTTTDLSTASVEVHASPWEDLVPSKTMCSAVGNISDQFNRQYCLYSKGVFVTTEFTSSFPLGVQFPPECVYVPVKCATLWADANDYPGEDACGLYGGLQEKQIAKSLAASGFWDVIDWIDVDDYSVFDNSIYEQICNDDPCLLGQRAGMGKCAYTAGENGGTCAAQ